MTSEIDKLVSRIASNTRLDAWANVTTGIGVPGTDKTADFRVTSQRSVGTAVNDTDLLTLFHESSVYRKGCFKPTEIELAKGFDIDIGDLERRDDLIQALTNLRTIPKIQEARALARGFGGAAIWVIANDGQDQSRELIPERVQTVSKLMVFDRRYVTPVAFYDRPEDTFNPKFQEPRLFEVRFPGKESQEDPAIIHESRLLLFHGLTKTADYRMGYSGSVVTQTSFEWWGLPFAVPALDAIVRNAASMANAGYMLHDASFSILKLGKLKQILASKGADAIGERARAVELVRSAVRAVIIGDDEEYQRVAPNFGNLPDMLKEMKFDLASAFDMPVTVLFGQAPAGLNATGESDLQLWHQKVAADREYRTTPAIQRLVEVVSGGVHADVPITYPALDEPTEQEKADIRLKQAQADRIYFDMGLSAGEIFLSRFTERGYSTDTTIDRDFWEESKDIDTDPESLLDTESTPEDGDTETPPATSQDGSEAPESGDGAD